MAATNRPAAAPTRVVVAGPGTIGLRVATEVDRHPQLALCGIVGRDRATTRRRCDGAGLDVPILDVTDLPGPGAVVVDTAPTAAFPAIATPTLEAGAVLVTVNTAALIDAPDLVGLAARGTGRIVVATGALVGLDAVRAAAHGSIQRVHMVTRKPPTAFTGASAVTDLGIDLHRLDGPVKLFSGSARDGARRFPANVNVAASLALAGIGLDATELEIWADPALDRNTHRITVEADSATLRLEIDNVPTDTNPGTGRLTALSVIDALIGLAAPVRIGS